MSKIHVPGPVLLGKTHCEEYSPQSKEVDDENAAMIEDRGSPAAREKGEANGSHFPSASGGDRRKDEEGVTRMDTIDGLRGLGALLVVAYHLRFGVRSAWVCIGLFFALSGFLMTTKVLQIQGKKGEFSIRHFWRSRILRLIPALLAIILCILVKNSVVWAIYGRPGGVELGLLRNDLLWAVMYGENWNLVNEEEDYFADTKKASVVRHIWSLSIEEQYYILWPIIFAGITRLAACRVPVRDMDFESNTISVMSYMLKPDVRFLVKVLCVFEVSAIVFSQLVGFHVYQRRGESAAYFSTYSRAGEFAVGGLSACLLHLSPWSLSLFTRDPDRPPMTENQRIGLEVASAVSVLSILGCSVIPLPLSDLLRYYFEWFRLPFTTVVLFCGTLQTLQMSEPLPSWAIFTRFISSRPLVYFGTTSYGLYLIHWVLIVWFGDSEVNTMHSSETLQGRMEGASAWGRDVSIAIASVAISAASFWFFERPVMVRAAHLRPGVVIGVAFASMAAVAGLVMAVTHGAMDRAAATVSIQDQLKSAPDQVVPTKMLFLGDSQADQIVDKMRSLTNDAAENKRCEDFYEKQPEWGPRVINGGQGGEGAIQVFGSEECTYCEMHTRWNRKTGSESKKAIWKANAPYIFVMDSHWLRPWNDHDKMQSGLWGMEPELKKALRNFIQFSAWHGAQHIFLSTGSPFTRMQTSEPRTMHWENKKLAVPDQYKVNAPMRQRTAFLEVLKRMKCTDDDEDGSKQPLLVSVVDYHKLVCPDFDAEKAERMQDAHTCDQSGPGFRTKLKEDRVHPNDEKGGYYLVRQLQRVLHHGIAKQGTFFGGAFRAPVRCYDKLYEKEPDGLEELLHTFEVCVDRDEEERPEPVEVRHERVSVDLSLERDIYMCRFFELPKMKVGAGITALDVLYQEDSRRHIHHIGFFSCDIGFEPEEGLEGSFECTRSPHRHGCSRMINTFGDSGESFRLPDGYMFTSDSGLALLQVHYKATHSKEPLLDSTGLRVSFGRFLKSVQFFELGPRDSHMLSIPPRSERYAVQSVCSSDDISAAMGRYALDEFEIIGVNQHMHLAGIAIKTEVLHPNGTSTAFAVMTEYNPHSQQMQLLPQRIVVSQGDAMKVTCVYSTHKRSQKTNLGISLTDEMCFSYMLMTPRLPLFSNCWHWQRSSSSQGDASSERSSLGLDHIGHLFAGSQQSAPQSDNECYNTVFETFAVEPTVAVQGPGASAAAADVFQGVQGACVAEAGSSRRRGGGGDEDDGEGDKRKHRKGKGSKSRGD